MKFIDENSNSINNNKKLFWAGVSLELLNFILNPSLFVYILRLLQGLLEIYRNLKFN